MILWTPTVKKSISKRLVERTLAHLSHQSLECKQQDKVLEVDKTENTENQRIIELLSMEGTLQVIKLQLPLQ